MTGLLTLDDMDRIGKARKAPGAGIVASVIREVCAVAGVSEAQLRAKNRKASLVALRRVAMYRAHEMGASYAQIARVFQVDHTTVMHHVQREREART